MTQSDTVFLSEFATEIEGTSIDTEKSCSLLGLFYEDLEGELDFLDFEKPWTVRLVKERITRLLLFLSVIQRDISQTQKAIDTNYDTLRSFLAIEGTKSGEPGEAATGKEQSAED